MPVFSDQLSFTVIEDEEKHQIFTIEKLEPANFWLKND